MFGDDDLRAEEGTMTAVRESFIRHAITFPGFVGDRDLFFHATRDAMREVDRLRAEVERLTPPAHERHVRFSTELAEQMSDWSEPVRLKVEDGPDGFLVLTAKFVNALPTAPEVK